MNNILKTFEEFPKWAKALLIFLTGGIIPAVYRIIKYLDTKSTNTLLVGILAFVPCIGTVVAIIDIISELTDNRIKFMVE
jgi:4-amino-4-deoxy-L-arabinose transferase-like glycosyltransferase